MNKMIDQLLSMAELESGVLCKAFTRHTFEGNVYEEGPRPHHEWVARLVCVYCSTKRKTRMEPETFLPLNPRSPHTYRYSERYDSSISSVQARKNVYDRIRRATL